MKAVILVEPGTRSNLVAGEVDAPQLGGEEVRVQARSISISPVESRIKHRRAKHRYCWQNLPNRP